MPKQLHNVKIYAILINRNLKINQRKEDFVAYQANNCIVYCGAFDLCIHAYGFRIGKYRKHHNDNNYNHNNDHHDYHYYDYNSNYHYYNHGKIHHYHYDQKNLYQKKLNIQGIYHHNHRDDNYHCCPGGFRSGGRRLGDIQRLEQQKSTCRKIHNAVFDYIGYKRKLFHSVQR